MIDRDKVYNSEALEDFKNLSKSAIEDDICLAEWARDNIDAILAALQPCDVEGLSDFLYTELGADHHLEKVIIKTAIEKAAQQGHLRTAEWLPIESAPKDGTIILAVWENNHGVWRGVLHWNKYEENWQRGEDLEMLTDCNTVTHWQPLSEPPT